LLPFQTVEMLASRTATSDQNPDNQKRAAAARALDYVRSGMRLGLGTGSTAAHFVDLLAERVKGGLKIVGVPTSDATRAQAERLGVPLTTLDREPELDLTVDGADEIDPSLDLIKGGGGALLREKIVAAASREMIVIADESKYVQRLGRFPLPIEVVDFGVPAVQRSIERALAAEGCAGSLQLRRKADGHVFVTDQGHFILDAALSAIPDGRALARRLAEVAGVVEHGLFIGLARRAILAGSSGVRVVERA
jgi:ribose 5-phosphate isomerase A